VFIFCELLVDGKAVSSNELFFQPYKDLGLSKAQISTSINRIRSGFTIALTTDKFARAAYLSVENAGGTFSDNYFDLSPGRTTEVEFHAHDPITLNEFRRRLKVRSLADAF